MQLNLVPVVEEDLPLAMEILGDPRMMLHLGGALSPEAIETAHGNAVRKIAAGNWWFKIVLDELPARVAGTIGIWETKWLDQPINEMGWSILLDFQRRGIASQAAALVLNRARREKRFRVIHAFPSVTNVASNAICQKAGFSLQEEVDLDYLDRQLRCNV